MIRFAAPPEVASVYMSPSKSNTIVLPSDETSSDIQVPSSVVNSIFLSVLSGRPSSFLSLSFESSFFSSSFCGSCANEASGIETSETSQTRMMTNSDDNERTRIQPVMISSGANQSISTGLGDREYKTIRRRILFVRRGAYRRLSSLRPTHARIVFGKQIQPQTGQSTVRCADDSRSHHQDSTGAGLIHCSR